MYSRFIPDDEVKRIARDILREDFSAEIAEHADFKLVQTDPEPGAEVWLLEVSHPSGTKLDYSGTFKARGRIASAVLKAGDDRLIVLSHRFKAPNPQAA